MERIFSSGTDPRPIVRSQYSLHLVVRMELPLPHPIANLTEAQLDQRAREIAPEVVKLLLQGQE